MTLSGNIATVRWTNRWPLLVPNLQSSQRSSALPP